MNRPPQGPDRWAIGIAIIAVLLLGGCNTLPTESARPSETNVQGITFVDWSANGYSSGAADNSMRELALTGANTATILVTAYQEKAESEVLRPDDPRTPTRASVLHAIAQAQDQGLMVAIKPHVDLDDGSWRGMISPPDAAVWFDSYRQFLLPWAGLADSVGATLFMVGTELAGTLGHEAHWLETIRQVRARYSGALVYAASWDEAMLVPFWRECDLVGVDFYFPVARRNDPGRLEILAAWQPWLERLHRLHAQTGRPVLLTEIGYRSVDGAAMHPYRFDNDATLDLEEQSDLYWAALTATRELDWFEGMMWWNWPADGSGGPANTDYTPSAKPASGELISAWRTLSSGGKRTASGEAGHAE
jgi:hypothetical protein